MIHHGNEQIEEQRRATSVHLHLHGAAAFERVAAADDESEVVSTKLRVRRRCVAIGVAG